MEVQQQDNFSRSKQLLLNQHRPVQSVTDFLQAQPTGLWHWDRSPLPLHRRRTDLQSRSGVSQEAAQHKKCAQNQPKSDESDRRIRSTFVSHSLHFRTDRTHRGSILLNPQKIQDFVCEHFSARKLKSSWSLFRGIRSKPSTSECRYSL